MQTVNDARTLSNPEVTLLARKLIQRLELELRQMMLNNDDAALVLLAAAHGRARAANWTRDGLVGRAAAVWEECERGREPMRTSLDYDVRDIPMRLFLDANRVAAANEGTPEK